MRYSEIDEMIGVKKFQNMTSSEIEKYFRGGIGNVKLLGVGMHAMALQIGNEAYKFWMIDSAYEAFAQYCLKHQDNPFLPKFHSGIKKMPAFFLRDTNAPDVVKYVKMEILQNARHMNNYSWTAHPEFQDADEEDEWGSYRYVNLNTAIQTCDKALFKDLGGFTDALTTLRGDRIKYESKNFDPELIQLIQTLMDLHELGNFEFDLHQGNIMARGEQPVILDPIAHRADVNLNDEFLRFASRPARVRTGGKTASRTSSPESNGEDKTGNGSE